MSNKKPQILIIGAGASGISAAVKLIESGVDNLLILEANNRIGGRIESIKFGDGFIDLGAQWVSGEKNNSVFEMCNTHFDFGTTEGFKPENMIALKSNGETVDEEKFFKLLELLDKLMDETEDIKSYESVGKYFEEKYFDALKNPEFDDIDESLRKMFLSYWHRYINAFFSSNNWYDVSGKFYHLTKICDGDQFLTWKRQGYKTVFDFITVRYFF